MGKINILDIPTKFFSRQIQLKKAIRAGLLELRKQLTSSTPVSSGIAKRSWSQPIISLRDKAHLQGKIKNVQPYSRVLQEGSKAGQLPWRSAREKTVKIQSRIFSSQLPGGFIKNLDVEKIKKKAEEKLIKS